MHIAFPQMDRRPVFGMRGLNNASIFVITAGCTIVCTCLTFWGLPVLAVVLTACCILTGIFAVWLFFTSCLFASYRCFMGCLACVNNALSLFADTASACVSAACTCVNNALSLFADTACACISTALHTARDMIHRATAPPVAGAPAPDVVDVFRRRGLDGWRGGGGGGGRSANSDIRHDKDCDCPCVKMFPCTFSLKRVAISSKASFI